MMRPVKTNCMLCRRKFPFKVLKRSHVGKLCPECYEKRFEIGKYK